MCNNDDDDDRDDLSPAKGVLLAVGLSVLFWAAVAWLMWRFQ